MAFEEPMADGAPPGTGPEQAPSGSSPFSSEKSKSPFPPGTKFTDKGRPIWPAGGSENLGSRPTTEKKDPSEYPPGTLFTKKGKPIFRVAGGADDEPPSTEEHEAPGPRVEDPINPFVNDAERSQYERSRDAEKGFPEEAVKKYTESVANEGREQSFYNMYQELEYYKQNRQFGKLRQRVNNILATLDIDEAGEAPGVGEMLQYMNVVFAEPQYEAFRSEISNWIEARQITHNVAFAAKYLKSEQWGSGITNIRGRHLKALMRDAGVNEASTLLEAHNEEGEAAGNKVTGARGYYYRTKDEAVDETAVLDADAIDKEFSDEHTQSKGVLRTKKDILKLVQDGKMSQDKADLLLKSRTVMEKILDAENGDYSELSDKEKKATWSLRQKLKLIDKMWDSFGVENNGKIKDFLGMTDVYKLAGLKGFPDRTDFYSDEGVFETDKYQQALKTFFRVDEPDSEEKRQSLAEIKTKVENARTHYKKLLIYGMNYMFKSDELDKYHSAHRALYRIKQEGDQGDAKKAELLKDGSGRKIVSKSVTEYLSFSDELNRNFPTQLKNNVDARLEVIITQSILEENAKRQSEGKPIYTPEELIDRQSALKEKFTPELIVEQKAKLEKQIDEVKAKFILDKNLKAEEVTNVEMADLSELHLEDIEQVFGQLNRAFVIAEKIHHASGQSAEFDGLKWKQNAQIPDEIAGSDELGYRNLPGGAIIVDPILWYDDEEDRDIDPETGRKKIGSGSKIAIHLATDMMPIDEENDSEEVKKRKKAAIKVAREKSGMIAAAWSKAYRELYIKNSDLIDYDGSISGRGARDKKKLHHKPADYWNAGELNSGKYKELRKYGYVNTIMIQQFFELGTNQQLADDWDRFFNRIKYNTGRWNAMEKLQSMYDKSGPRLLYDFHAMNDPEHLVKTLSEFYKASLALTEFNDEHGDTEVQSYIGDLAKGILDFRVNHSTDYGHKNLNYNQIDLVIEKLELAHIVEHAVPDQMSANYLGPEWYRIFRTIYSRVDKPGAFGAFIAEMIKQFSATSKSFSQ